ncbi:MAG TPA: HIT domain-containing protein [Chromatiales bacterium]|nr:HIT domain-containing protein [Chromatiales bacterium]
MNYDDNNIFARILRGELPAHKVHEDEQILAILDVLPQSEGHTLMLSKAPATSLFDLPDDVAATMLPKARRLAQAVQSAFDADGIRLMQLNGAAAGQTIFHFHLHIIPFYEGRAMRRHAREPADEAVLAEHAQRIRAALEQL